MKKFLKTTWAVLLYLWQLPQNLIGLAYREPVYDHEFGHVRQSRRWGWLWLPVFAIPSGLHSLFCRAANYYHFYTERSANRLGGVPNYAGEYHYHMDGLIVTYWHKLVELKNRYLQ